MLPPKKNTVKDKEKTGLSSADQMAVNREWEKGTGKKLPKGENAALSESAYTEWKKTGKLNYTYYNPKPMPEPVKRVDVSKLPTKKATQIGPPSSVPQRVRPKDAVLNSDKKEQKFVPTAKTKKLTKSGKPVIGSNIVTGAKNIIGKAKFEKEKRQSEAGKRALRGTGESGTTGVNRLTALKDQKKSLKEARKVTGVNIGKALKETRQGIRYEKKALRGRTKYKG